MGLLAQMEFLLLGPCGITTLSSTMVELIYTPTNSVKVFLLLHILSSICCLLMGLPFYFSISVFLKKHDPVDQQHEQGNC